MSDAGAISAIQRLVPSCTGGLRILCYHLVGAGTGSPVDVPAVEFERHMRALHEHACPVSLQRGLAAVRTGSTEQLVAVTFDDAFRNFLEAAWPVLQRLRIPVTVFVPTGFVTGTIPSPLANVDLPPCNWPELRELAASDLVDIGSHTCSHMDLRILQTAQLRAELRDSRSLLEDRLGVQVGSFCYPRALWNRRCEAEVAGVYDLAVVGGGRRNGKRTSPLRLSRTSVRSGPPLAIERWMRSSLWIQEAAADLVRRARRRSLRPGGTPAP